MNTMTATYSPEDNKLRLYTSARLDSETYARVKAAGFAWAPKQQLFVAPKWTPEREDLLIELCGEIDDEDKSLAERAEERAERFEDYRESRTKDAAAAARAVASIADHIPLGQPILVGHHSERRARKDAERIRASMTRAVKAWRTADYWRRRAAGAVSAAKYKERPDVRYRRIKGLEADLRKATKTRDASLFNTPIVFDQARAERIASLDQSGARWPLTLTRPDGSTFEAQESTWGALRAGKITPEEARAGAITAYRETIARCERWIEHYENRLTYERAMLGADAPEALRADAPSVEVGGTVERRGVRAPILRVNKKGGSIASVTIAGRWGKEVIGIEEVTAYEPPAPGVAEKVKAATKLAPLCNYPVPGCREMTTEEFKRATRASDFYGVDRIKATETHGAHRRRRAPADAGSFRVVPVFLTDAKRVDPPPASEEVQA